MIVVVEADASSHIVNATTNTAASAASHTGASRGRRRRLAYSLRMRPIILRPWAILLAAGGSRRFGRPKQLVRIRGETFLRHAATLALAACPERCVVVLGAHATRLAGELKELPVRIAVNRRWRAGLSTSLRTGLAALPASAPAALIMLADQVDVSPADLRRLLKHWRRQPRAIVASLAEGVRRPPAVLPRASFASLRRIRGDAGARGLLADPHRQVIEVGLASAAIDVDRPADLGRIRRRSAAREIASGLLDRRQR